MTTDHEDLTMLDRGFWLFAGWIMGLLTASVLLRWWL